ncbi:hypothetical protein N657DRAFT_307887 [Parathielavia appendiculata]|uniref:Uncharacterized protein n=1 Tax=Parathielavia appendiculata TaxID=2587402 RepID=A0AAN6Z634_9PEZI|nr:hypothetical protein N657DRAFT_307887 [Parathielavia appendiculata]
MRTSMPGMLRRRRLWILRWIERSWPWGGSFLTAMCGWDLVQVIAINFDSVRADRGISMGIRTLSLTTVHQPWSTNGIPPTPGCAYSGPETTQVSPGYDTHLPRPQRETVCHLTQRGVNVLGLLARAWGCCDS